MSTSATDIKRASRTALVYLAISLFCAVFGAVYECFSHGVYSPFMMLAFVIPLLLGAVPFFILKHTGCKKYPSPFSLDLYHSGVATLTVGSLIRGVLDIYGTTNVLTAAYLPAGASLIFISLIIYVSLKLNKNLQK